MANEWVELSVILGVVALCVLAGWVLSLLSPPRMSRHISNRWHAGRVWRWK